MKRVAMVIPVLHLKPFHVEWTEKAVHTAKERTSLPFDVIISESDMGKERLPDPEALGAHHLLCESPSSYVQDFNAGIRYARSTLNSDYVVHTGNDVLMGEQWLESLLEPFEKYEDCGASTTSVIETFGGMHQGVIGHNKPIDKITEGFYGPLLMFRSSDELDEDYEGKASDDDLIMRIYTRGQRTYRNLKSVARHVGGMTQDVKPGALKVVNDQGAQLFHERWKDSPLDCYQKMTRGAAIWGKEHDREPR